MALPVFFPPASCHHHVRFFYCGVPTHATRKAKVETFRFYVKENEAKAFLDPSIDSRYFTDEQVAILLSQVHSRFTQKNSG